MNDAWRYRCPQGHPNLTNGDDTYRCESCGETYWGDPYDAAETEFPVDDEPIDCDETAILQELVEVCGQATRSRMKSDEFDVRGTVRMIGHRLAIMERDGLVERIEVSHSGNWWRPTEAGIQQADRAELTPVSAGLLVFALGLVYLVALVLINGGAL